MRVCFVSPEVFSWGIHGGIGYVTKTLSEKLVELGVEVYIVTPKRAGQKEVENLNGINVYGYNPYSNKSSLHRIGLSRINSQKFYRIVNAEIYHSQEASYNTFIAQNTLPKAKHVITFQDPYNIKEWKKIAKVDKKYKQSPIFRSRLLIEKLLLSHTCKKAHALYTQANFLIPRVYEYYGLKTQIKLIPNPIIIKKHRMMKSRTPTFCFLGRWDPQKRVEIFLNLPRVFPKIKFICMGHSHDPFFDSYMREKYGKIPNLILTGFISENEKSDVLEKSWGLINTSIREALPVSFLEALAHETPIISGEDPEFITSKFGYKVIKDDFRKALTLLMNDEKRIKKGKEGRKYVEEKHDLEKVARIQLNAYESVLKSDGF
ncbi:glycosyltransferase family 4 protein [Candidatus Bathyarchaeota archaeon]|nr:glycosyltransferase family 4 protein [Candidatus Bathyarchaeota archaeon]